MNGVLLLIRYVQSFFKTFHAGKFLMAVFKIFLGEFFFSEIPLAFGVK